LKLSDAEIENLTGKSFKIIINNGKNGILQSTLWKELDLTSRDGSRVAIRLEKRSLIKREKILENGRWTYKLFAAKLPVDTQTIQQAPCLTCPVEHMCSVDGIYSPNNCTLIENWILTSFDDMTRHQLNSSQVPQNKAEEDQLIVKEQKSMTKRQPKRATKGSRK
jgi:hypothetical protein